MTCTDYCKICASANTCQECMDGYFLDLTLGTCSSNCRDYKYPNNMNNCVPCEDSISVNTNWCKDCTNVVEKGKYCSVCEDPSNSQDQKYVSQDLQGCLDNCPPGEVPNSNNICVKCPDNCIHCDPTATNVCNVCSNTHVLSN